MVPAPRALNVPASLTGHLAGCLQDHPLLIARYARVLPDTTTATRLLWRDLHGAIPQVPLTLDSMSDRSALENRRHVLVLLVLLEGWDRIKGCAREGCTRYFADASPAASRRHCDLHSRHRSSGTRSSRLDLPRTASG